LIAKEPNPRPSIESLDWVQNETDGWRAVSASKGGDFYIERSSFMNTRYQGFVLMWFSSVGWCYRHIADELPTDIGVNFSMIQAKQIVSKLIDNRLGSREPTSQNGKMYYN